VELIPVQVAIDATSPPYIWAVMMDPRISENTLSRSLWKRPLLGNGEWERVKCPEIDAQPSRRDPR
jgi:hypothetical protein